MGFSLSRAHSRTRARSLSPLSQIVTTVNPGVERKACISRQFENHNAGKRLAAVKLRETPRYERQAHGGLNNTPIVSVLAIRPRRHANVQQAHVHVAGSGPAPQLSFATDIIDFVAAAAGAKRQARFMLPITAQDIASCCLALVVTASTVLARHVKPQTILMPDCTCLPKDSVTVVLPTLPRPPL
jgi:hypothetical protein